MRTDQLTAHVCLHGNKRFNKSFVWFSDPEEAEGLSVTSEPEEPEVEDAELQAATQHLTQDFLCQVIQEEEGRDKTTGDSKQEVGTEKDDVGPQYQVPPQRQVPPLAVILGKLTSSCSLDLQNFNESEAGQKPDGKEETSSTST